jgi:hypothetical protein
MPEPYEPHIALARIRSILRDGGLAVLSHCRQRMLERDVYDEDILKVLNENGTINSEPKLDNKHQRYKYQVDGFDVDGDPLSVVVNIIEQSWIVVTITVFGD